MSIELEATNMNDESGRYRMLILNQFEHDDPEQAPTYRQPERPAAVPDPATAREIGLTGILRMTAEQVDQALREFESIEAAA